MTTLVSAVADVNMTYDDTWILPAAEFHTLLRQ